VTSTEPLPVPPVALSVTQGGALAVQAHEGALATMDRAAAPPVLGKSIAAGETVNVQPLFVLTVTGIGMPAIVTEPVSVLLVMFVAALT
jgi:hypothetical protein